MSSASFAQSTKIELGKPSQPIKVDLGRIPAGLETVAHFEALNNSGAKLNVVGSTGSCACVAGHIDREEADDGQVFHFQIVAKPSYATSSLSQRLELKFLSGGKEIDYSVEVRAEVQSLVEVSPQRLVRKAGATTWAELTFRTGFPERVKKLVSVVGPDSLLSSTRVTPDRAGEITVKIEMDKESKTMLSPSSTLPFRVSYFDQRGARREASVLVQVESGGRVIARPSRCEISEKDGKSVVAVLLLTASPLNVGDAFTVRTQHGDVVGAAYVRKSTGKSHLVEIAVDSDLRGEMEVALEPRFKHGFSNRISLVLKGEK